MLLFADADFSRRLMCALCSRNQSLIVHRIPFGLNPGSCWALSWDLWPVWNVGWDQNLLLLAWNIILHEHGLLALISNEPFLHSWQTLWSMMRTLTYFLQPSPQLQLGPRPQQLPGLHLTPTDARLMASLRSSLWHDRTAPLLDIAHVLSSSSFQILVNLLVLIINARK